MNKKKIGELEGTPIVTGEKNYANEHEYYMTLNGDNTYQKLEQRTNGDQFRLVLGGGNGSQQDSGYSVTKSYTTLVDESVEVINHSTFNEGLFTSTIDLVAGKTYKVSLDGVEYECQAIDDGSVFIGDMSGSFSDYPFVICADNNDGHAYIDTPEAGTYSVKVEELTEEVTTTPEFEKAVDSVTGYSIDKGNETLFDGTVETRDYGGYIEGIITPTITFVVDDTYRVTFNGTEYTCKCFGDEDVLNIGAPFDEGEEDYDWSTYPFNIATYPSGGEQYETGLTTSQEGSYTLKIEHLTVSTKTTPGFESMIQGIVGGSGSGSDNIIVYPDSVSFIDVVYSAYNNPPEQGKIYFIPFTDTGSPYGQYLYPVHIDELTSEDNEFTGYATIIGNPIITDNGTLTAQPFNHTINPPDGTTKGLCISYSSNDYNNNYRLYYDVRTLA